MARKSVKLPHGSGNGRSPGGEPESRLWLAVAGRGQESPNSPARRKSAADPKAGGVSGASSDDVSAGPRFVGVGGDGVVGKGPLRVCRPHRFAPTVSWLLLDPRWGQDYP